MLESCTVCRASTLSVFQEIDGKTYWRCATCHATLLDPAHHLGAAEERSHYLLHENRVEDSDYRTFLSKLAGPVLAELSPASEGLDYGCGPGPALAAMLGEAGHAMRLYDPFFHPDKTALVHAYDFVTCSETAEHFHRPAEEFDRLDSLVRPGGLLAIMTCFQTDDTRFAKWHYRQDPTHVVFYRAETYAVLAQQRGWHYNSPAKDVALLRKAA
ncbi:MAG: class I SAM-dependent methyltransferase [Pseudomonadota bacterium]